MFKNVLSDLYGAMWHYGRGHRLMVVVFILLITTGAVLLQLTPYVFGRIFTGLQNLITGKSGTTGGIYTFMGWYAAAAVGSLVFHAPGRFLERRFAFYVRENCLNDLYTKMQALPLEWHQNHHSGNVTDRIRNAAAGLHAFVESQYRIIRSVVNTIIPLVFLWLTAKILAVLCLAGGVLSIGVIVLIDRKLVPVLDKKRDLGHTLAAVLVDYITNIQTIITLRLGRQTRREVAERLRAEQPVYDAEAAWTELKWATMDTLMALMQVAVVGYLIYAFQQGTITEIGRIAAAFQYLQAFAGVFYGLTSQYEQIVRQGNDYQSSFLIAEAYDNQHRDSADTMDEATAIDSLVVRDLSFAYRGEHAQGQIKDIHLDIRAGQKVAFVGSSGSGKSTILKLLRGLYDIEQGTLTIDGKTAAWHQLANITTLIPQEPEIFENTIRYNITMGVTHDEADIMAACTVACFDSVLEQLPHGLDTDIREKGVNLSGGQKQRLALARGVFAAQASQLILLDEPTSSIDGLTERAIYGNLFAAFAGKIIAGSIHRLHLLNQFDLIYIFEKGRIVQSGALDDLLAHEGPFKRLWDAYQQGDDAEPMA